MRPILKWFVQRFSVFLVFPSFLQELTKQWMNILFGETILGAAFIIWWALGNPPLKLLFVLAALLAGFYAWYGSYARLMPGIRIGDAIVHQTPTDQANIKRSYLQIIPECISESPIENCRGHLLRVWKRKPDANKWEATALNQPLELLWSYKNNAVLTLQPGLGQRLNVAWIDSQMPRLNLDVTQTPMSAYSVFSSTDVFKFEIQITGDNCVPANVELEVQNGTKWNELYVK